jgi:hypothetical protein
MTPYQRLLKYEYLPEQVKKDLLDRYSSLNPVRLSQEIKDLQASLYEVYITKYVNNQEKFKGRSVGFLNCRSIPVSVR